MLRLRRLWVSLRSSFWFVPGLIVAGSAGLAVGLIELPAEGLEDQLMRWPRLFGAGPEGARSILSTIAGSMMSVVGVTFSMTLVTLALASSQYTSRILRNFMADPVTQVVLGVFAGIFTYCLILLRTIRGGEDGGFVPRVAVLTAVGLAIGSIAVLIFFIHRIASSIQASSIVSAVASETMGAIKRLFPERIAAGAPTSEDAVEGAVSERRWQTVAARGNGYIDSIDSAALLAVARAHQGVIRMEQGIGAFVIHESALVSISLPEPASEEVVAALRNAFSLSRHRTTDQDVAFGIRQIVDIALKALSPSVNDTTTAIICVDYLTAIMHLLAGCSVPSKLRYEDGELRVIALRPDFPELLAAAFDEIRANATGNTAVLLRLLWSLQVLAGVTDSPRRRKAILEHLDAIAELAERSLPAAHDRRQVGERLASVRGKVDVASG